MSKKLRREEPVAIAGHNGLEDLGKAVEGLTLKIPELGHVPDLQGLVGNIEEQGKVLKKMGEDVGTAVTFLRTADATVNKYAGVERKLAAKQVATGKVQMAQFLDGVFEASDVVCRQVAAVAYVKATLSGEFPDSDAAWAAFHDLEARGIIVAQSGGPIDVCHSNYQLKPEFAFDEGDTAEISAAITKFAGHLTTLVYNKRLEVKKEIEAEAQITLADAMANPKTHGKCSVHVPAEQFEFCETHKRSDCRGKPGEECAIKTMWRGGGELLMEFANDFVRPLRAAGSIERIIREMVSMEVSLPRYTLKWEAPPGIGYGQFAKTRDAIARARGLSTAEAEAYLKKEQVLWHLIDRVLRHEEMAEGLDEEALCYEEDSTITPVEFFGLNGNGGPVEGTSCVKLEESFRDGSQTIDHVFFMAASRKNGTQWEIGVVRVPEHLKDILGGFENKWYQADDSFGRCPSMLSRILKVARGLAQRDHQIALTKSGEGSNAG